MPGEGINNRVIVTGAAVIFTVLFGWLIIGSPTYEPSARIPGMDNRPKGLGENDSVQIGEFFDLFSSNPAKSSGSWPRFRGSDYNNISKDATPTLDSWPDEGPPVLWKIALGEGHAAPSVYEGRVYILDYDEKKRADALRCFSLETGEELWKRWYHVAIKRNHGISRTIPTVTDKYILSMGPRCHVMCLDRESGELLWTLDPVRDFGAEIPQWYTAQCPLVDNDIAIIAIGGDDLLLGIDCATGEIKWKTPNPDSWKMSHSSVLPATIHGKRMYIYMAVGGVCGVSAEPGDIGTILWKTSEWSPTVVATSPLYLGNNQILVTTGYGAGGARIIVEKTTTGFSASVTETHTPKDGLSSEQQTPLMTGDYIWTINPKDAGAMRNQLTCYHRSDLRTPVWSSGKESRFGLGPYMVVGDKMFLLNDDSELFMYRIGNGNATLLDSYRVIEDGADAWGPLAFVDGYLLLRDSRTLVCIDIRK
jgi:outer membrane protein assembly factor BamB